MTMKTTIDVNDDLLIEAKRTLKDKKQTLESILETALQQFLEEAEANKKPFKLRKHTFRGQGLQLDIKEDYWAAIKELAYKGDIE